VNLLPASQFLVVCSQAALEALLEGFSLRLSVACIGWSLMRVIMRTTQSLQSLKTDNINVADFVQTLEKI